MDVKEEVEETYEVQGLIFEDLRVKEEVQDNYESEGFIKEEIEVKEESVVNDVLYSLEERGTGRRTKELLDYQDENAESAGNVKQESVFYYPDLTCGWKSSDNSLEFKSEFPVTANPSLEDPLGRRPREKHFCYFCRSLVQNFSRHVRRRHASEAEVQEILSKPVNSRERKGLTSRLRKKGDFLRISKNHLKILMGKSDFPSCKNGLLPCSNCLGFYVPKTLWRHRKACPGSDDDGGGRKSQQQAQVEGQNLLVDGGSRNLDPLLKESVFPRMRADNVSLVAKKDRLICAFGADYLRTHGGDFCVNVTSRKMRELARLLVGVKRLEPSVETLHGALKPRYFGSISRAARALSGYDADRDRFESPTFAASVVQSLKYCCDLASIDLSKEKASESVRIDLTRMIDLLSSNWTRCKSALGSRQSGAVKKKKRELVPWTKRQKTVVKRFFDRHISEKKPPRKHECEELLRKHGELLHNKSWVKIKVFVQNVYTKM